MIEEKESRTASSVDARPECRPHHAAREGAASSVDVRPKCRPHHAAKEERDETSYYVI